MAIESNGEHMRFIKLRIRLSAISSFFALALGASIFGPASVVAQQQAVLWGVVSDAVTGEIVDAAAVTLVGTGIETRTAVDGIFEFPDAPLGFVTVRVQAPGYPAVVEQVEMTPGTVRIMQVILPSVDAVLREILVVVPATDAARRGDARSAADLLARKVLGITATGGPYDSPILLRGVNSISVNSEAVIFLDGVRLSNGFGNAMDLLRLISAADVKEIRVLPGPAAAFLQGSASGAILVETKFGLPDGD